MLRVIKLFICKSTYCHFPLPHYPRGRLFCSLQSRARSCVSLVPVSQLLKTEKDCVQSNHPSIDGPLTLTRCFVPCQEGGGARVRLSSLPPPSGLRSRWALRSIPQATSSYSCDRLPIIPRLQARLWHLSITWCTQSADWFSEFSLAITTCLEAYGNQILCTVFCFALSYENSLPFGRNWVALQGKESAARLGASHINSVDVVDLIFLYRLRKVRALIESTDYRPWWVGRLLPFSKW